MPASRGRLVAIIAVGAAALVIAAAAGWYFLIRGDAPPEVNLAAAVSTLADAALQPTEVAPQPTDGGAGTTDGGAATTAPAAAGVVWTVDGDGGSFVGYRVQEELASIGAATAVGRTTLVTGTMEIAGSTVTSVAVEADLTGLESDDSRRDRGLRTRGLETDAFSTATFVLAGPIDLGIEPAEGEAFSGVAAGDLTLHGVTRRVEVPIEGQFVDGAIVVVGSLPIEFADYDIDPPTGFVVLAVDDNGVMELQLVFRPA